MAHGIYTHDMCHVAYDTLHMLRDMRYVIHDMLYTACGIHM